MLNLLDCQEICVKVINFPPMSTGLEEVFCYFINL
jgi:hypothetical protein